MKREGKTKRLVLLSVVISIFLISFASAGIIDWIRETVTGRATSETTNVTVTIAGVNPVSIIVHNATLVDTEVDPTEQDTQNITFNVTVYDIDGQNDINTSSVKAWAIKVNEQTRSNTSGCVENSGESTTTSKNFSCTITMWYWDAQGGWTLNVSANDLGNLSQNSTDYYNFSYDQLQALQVGPEEVYWPTVAIGAENQTASNQTIVNNTGNYNITDNLEVNATNLYSGASFIDVGNVSIGLDTGSECNGTVMVNAEDTAISGAILERGNLTTGLLSNETLYYCMTIVPTSVPSGTYDTQTEGGWTIKLV